MESNHPTVGLPRLTGFEHAHGARSRPPNRPLPRAVGTAMGTASRRSPSGRRRATRAPHARRRGQVPVAVQRDRDAGVPMKFNSALAFTPAIMGDANVWRPSWKPSGRTFAAVHARAMRSRSDTGCTGTAGSAPVNSRPGQWSVSTAWLAGRVARRATTTRCARPRRTSARRSAGRAGPTSARLAACGRRGRRPTTRARAVRPGAARRRAPGPVPPGRAAQAPRSAAPPRRASRSDRAPLRRSAAAARRKG
jgi:hypothetical protein